SLMSEENYRRLLEAGIRRVVSTDTIPTFTSRVSVASLLADGLRKFLEG
ncbi:MAG: ribose-phosphate pyrophosphokinase, partial [Candidatus Hecatellales archaeon]